VKIRFAAMLLLCCLLLFGCSFGPAASDGDTLMVHIPKIGAADSFLITCGGESLLIDLGEEDDGAEILRLIKAEKIQQLDALIVTHFDKDHIGSAEEVLRAVPVARALEAGYEKDNKRYKAYRDALQNNSVPVIQVTEEVSFALGTAEVTVYPALSTYETDNDNSLAVVIEHGRMRLLFAGDAEDARMEELMGQLPKGPYDFVKIPHHGRYHENSGDFLAFCEPDFAVSTCSEKNPSEEALLSLLEQRKTKVFETRNGDVIVASAGNTLTVSQWHD